MIDFDQLDEADVNLRLRHVFDDLGKAACSMVAASRSAFFRAAAAASEQLAEPFGCRDTLDCLAEPRRPLQLQLVPVTSWDTCGGTAGVELGPMME